MGKAIEELAHFVADTPWETIPQAVREHAKLVLLDTVGVMLAGSVQREVADVRARLTASGGRGATVYAPGWPTTDPRTAALLNGLAVRSIELCEGHRYVSCQGAVQILPTALASGMARAVRPRDAGGADLRLRSRRPTRRWADGGSRIRMVAARCWLGAVPPGWACRLTGEQMSLALRIGAIRPSRRATPTPWRGPPRANVAGGDERLRRGSGARAARWPRGRTAQRHRGGLRPAGR